MIDIHIFAYSPRATIGGSLEYQVAARPGLTVKDCVTAADIGTIDSYVIMINGYGARPDSAVNDTDEVVLFPAIAGG